MRQTILVTGSTGLIGKELVKALIEKNNNVVALYHHTPPEQTRGIVPVCHDLSIPGQDLKSPMRSAVTVIHLAWDFGVKPSQSSPSVNYKMLKNVYDAASEVGVKKIIFVSALNASAYAVSPFLQEKYACERLLTQSKKDLERVIIRSPLLECSDQHQINRSILNTMQFPGFYPVPQSKESLAIGLVQQVVRDICNALSPSTYKIQIQNVSADYSTSVQDLFKKIATKGTKSGKLAIGGAVGNFIYDVAEKLNFKKTNNAPTARYFIEIGKEMSTRANDLPL